MESDSELFGSDTESDFDTDFDSDFSDNDVSSSESDANEDGEWSSDLHPVNVLPFREAVGPRHGLTEDATPKQYFDLLLEPDFYVTVAEQTNLYAEQSQRHRNTLDLRWKPTNAQEIKAFFAINIIMGLHSFPELDSYWSTDDRLGVPGIAKIMPKHRYKKINQYLHLVNNENNAPRGHPQYDPFFKVSPVVSLMSRTFHQSYKPHREITVDEAMVPYKGRHHCKQYVPSKPNKWGFKVWTIADSTNGYVLAQTLYRGRQSQRPEHGVGYEVVMDITMQYQWLRHHIYCDSLFMSVYLVESLLDRQTYICGTFKSDTRDMPLSVKRPGYLQHGQSVKRQKGNIVAVVWKDKRDVTEGCIRWMRPSGHRDPTRSPQTWSQSGKCQLFSSKLLLVFQS